MGTHSLLISSLLSFSLATIIAIGVKEDTSSLVVSESMAEH